jgi:6,7-dimethyl-8-ribityllumazine synthase
MIEDTAQAPCEPGGAEAGGKVFLIAEMAKLDALEYSAVKIVTARQTMSLSAPQPVAISGAPFKVGIAAARYNERFVGALLGQAVAVLRKMGVRERNLAIVRVPGSNELPAAVQLLAERRRPDVLVALGVIIRGDTIHYELIAEAVTHALQRVALDTRRPVINGVVVAENEAQAANRCLGRIDRGAEFARAALAMAALRRALSK